MYANELISTCLNCEYIYNKSNKRKLAANSTNQVKKAKNNPYDFILTNMKDNPVNKQNNSIKRKSNTLVTEDYEYEEAITSKRNLTAIIHSITESENKKIPVNDKCISCQSYSKYN